MVEVQGYNFPDDLRYTDDHVWVRKEDDVITVGFDDLASKLIGNILFVMLADEGTELAPGMVFGTVESMKWVERLKSPVSGTVKEVNQELEVDPTMVNREPYGGGWFIKVAPSTSAAEELSKLAGGPRLMEWAAREIERRQKQVEESKKKG
jgi:glycine cleavage system H protein